MTELEMDFRQLRYDRDCKLKESDFSQLLDFQDGITESEKTSWKNYRQQLRDMPDQTSDPKSVVWPTRPDQV